MDGTFQTAKFCSQNYLVVGSEDGSIYSFRYKSLDHPSNQVGRLTSHEITYRAAPDQETIFAFDSVRLLAGQCGENMNNVIESSSNIIDLADDARGDIVLIAGREMMRIGRAFYLFGLPIWEIKWPAIHHSKTEEG